MENFGILIFTQIALKHIQLRPTSTKYSISAYKNVSYNFCKGIFATFFFENSNIIEMLFFKVVSFQDNFSSKIMKICKLKCLKMNQESIFSIIIPEISFNFHDDRFRWYLCRFFQNYEISQKSWKISES